MAGLISINGKLDVITIGSASRDIFFITGRGKIIPDPSSIEGRLLAFSLGSKVSIETSHISKGGGACNAAASFARLGLKVSPYINVGRDEMGERITLELTQEGTDNSLIWVDENLQTGTSVILVPEGVGDRTILFHSGANRSLRIHNWQKIENTSWLYVSPITREAPELLHQIADFARQRSIKMANNPGLGQIERGFNYMAPVLEKLDILIVNRTEAILLLQSKEPGMQITDNRQLAAGLIKTGPKIAVVTCGSEGSYASDGDNIYYQDVIKSDIADVTGAGDSYGSTFVAAIIMGQDIRTAMLMAAINASSVISRLGAQKGLLRLDEIKRRAVGLDLGTQK